MQVFIPLGQEYLENAGIQIVSYGVMRYVENLGTIYLGVLFPYFVDLEFVRNYIVNHQPTIPATMWICGFSVVLSFTTAGTLTSADGSTNQAVGVMLGLLV